MSEQMSQEIQLEEFFKKYMKPYNARGSGMEFCNFRDFLNKNNLMPQNEVVKIADAEELRKYIRKILENPEHRYYTWGQARKKIELKGGSFYDAMIKLGFYDEENDCYTEKGKKNGIEYGLFTERVLKLIEDAAGYFYNIKDVFLIQWIGPFFSVAQCENWENTHSIQKGEYNFYFASGIQVKKEKTVQRFYIGKSEQELVSKRISSSSDSVKTKFRSGKEIWIGRFSDKKLRDSENGKREENHKCVEIAEWALIFGFLSERKSKRLLLNEKKTMNPPKRSVCVVNQFYSKTRRTILHEKNERIIEFMPDVIFYDINGHTKICSELSNKD